MNKLAAVAAVALVLAMLAMPRVVASVTEARVRERVAAIDASDSVAAELTAFERGWFRSSAKIALRLAPDRIAAIDSPQDGWLAGDPIPIAVEFAHGPIAVLDGIHIGWSKMIARLDADAPGVPELERTLGVPYVFEFRGRTAFGGSLDFYADAPAFELPIDEALLTFAGADLDGTFVGRRLTARAEIGGLELASPTGTFALRNIRADVDNELLSEYLMPGIAALEIERVSVDDSLRGSSPVFEASNLRVASVTELDSEGDLLDMRIDYAIDTARLEDGELTAANVSLALRDLDVAALEAYSAAMSDAAATTTDSAEIIRALAPELERALRAGPSLALDPLSFRLDGEPFEGRVELTTNPARLPPVGALNLDNPLLVLGLIDADAELRLSKVLAQRLATLAAKMQLGADPSMPPDQLDYLAEAQSSLMLTMMIGQGVLIEDGNDYRCTITLNNGTVTLNGNPMPFALP
jgi:uncharacterized protein YdgA (DUF945 family)